MEIKNKKILIIIGGGIAAYKSLDLIRLLRKSNNEIKTILTKSGKEFVTPLSISTLTNNKTFEDIFDKRSNNEIDHISLSRWADIIIVLPTTANFMTKLSIGKAEDLATTVILASNKDILLVPAMNVRMWVHKATQKNFKILQDYGYLFLGPERGEMACGEYGEVPFLQSVHEGIFDFSRYTMTGHSVLFKDFQIKKFGIVSGSFTSLNWSIRDAFRSIGFGMIGKILFLLFRLLGIFLPKQNQVSACNGTFILAQKDCSKGGSIRTIEDLQKFSGL